MSLDRERGRTREPIPDTAGEVDENRREALRTIARFGAYTAPGMLAIMTGEAYAQGSPGR
jgi:hypothetical protein